MQYLSLRFVVAYSNSRYGINVIPAAIQRTSKPLPAQHDCVGRGLLVTNNLRCRSLKPAKPPTETACGQCGDKPPEVQQFVTPSVLTADGKALLLAADTPQTSIHDMALRAFVHTTKRCGADLAILDTDKLAAPSKHEASRDNATHVNYMPTMISAFKIKCTQDLQCWRQILLLGMRTQAGRLQSVLFCTRLFSLSLHVLHEIRYVCRPPPSVSARLRHLQPRSEVPRPRCSVLRSAAGPMRHSRSFEGQKN